MKISRRQLRRIIREEHARNRARIRRGRAHAAHSTMLDEGWFSGALKGLVRAVPGFGDMAADAHTSSILDDLDEKLTDIVRRIEALERRGR